MSDRRSERRGGVVRRRRARWALTLAAVGLLGVMLVSELWAVLDIPVFGPVLSLGMFAHLVVTSFLWHMGVAALVVLAVCAVVRARVGVVAAAVVAVWALGPWVWSYSNAVPEVDDEGTLTVYSANLLYSRADLGEVMAQVDEIDADVVVLQEVLDWRLAEIDAVFSERFAYSYVRLDTHHPKSAKGSATYSRLPIVGAPERLAVEETPEGFAPWPMLRTSIAWGGGVVDVWNVHPAAPVRLSLVAIQDAGARALSAAIGAGDEPVVVAGDFNAPPRSVTLRRFERIGFGEAHAAVGSGLGATWPRRGVARHAPGTRIDHVMYRGVECVGSGVGGDIGSDHAPVWAVFTRSGLRAATSSGG